MPSESWAESEQSPATLNDYSSFNPKQYIQEYYAALGSENAFLLQFHHSVYRQIRPGGRLLEFGGGPSIYQLLSASRVMREIVFAEYLECNRRELINWLFSGPEAVDWTSYLDYVLKLEEKDPNETSRLQLQERVSSRVTQVIECDAWLPNILSPRSFAPFDVISSNFCLECITGSEEHFVDFMVKLSRHLRPGGLLVMTMLKNAKAYKVGSLHFPVFPLDEAYINGLLRQLNYCDIEVSSVPAEAEQGYSGIIGLTAVKL